MPRKPLPWFRWYCESVRDPKLRRIPPEQRWVWPAVLTIARESPEPGRLFIAEGMAATINDIADVAAVPVKVARAAVTYFLSAAGMLVDDGGIYVVPNFIERQYESDNSTNRTRKHRSKEQGRNVPTSGDGTDSSSVTTDLRGSDDSDADASSSSDDDDDPIFTEALRQFAERKMVGKTIDNRSGYRAEVMRTDRIEFATLRASMPDADLATLVGAFSLGVEGVQAAAASEESRATVRRGVILGQLDGLRAINDDGTYDDEIAQLEAEFVSLRGAVGIPEMAT